MPIEAELPDGRVLEFPDGTNPAVIQATVKRMLGVATEPAAVSKIKGLLPAPVADTLHQVADVPIGLQKGVMQGIRMVSDMFGANNAFSKSVKQNEEALANLMSAQAKNDQQEIARILKEAEDKGVLDQIKAGVKAFTVAPVDTLTSALGTAAPAIVAALGAKVLGAGALLTTGISMVTGAGMGTGAIKGTIYEETKKALQEAGVPEPIAEERAQKAQEYGGQNLDQILAGAAIGGVAARGPLEKGAVRAIASRISKNVAAREAAESVSEKAAKGAATGRIRAGVAEALPEAGQAAQEQIAANIAQQREGLDVPTFRGAVAAGTMEGLAGAGLGAAFGGGRPPVEQPAPGTLPDEKPIERAERLKAEAEAAKAAAQPPAPPVPTTAPAPGETAPVAEAAAPPEGQAPAPIEEPKVRKVGEPLPLPEVLDDATVKTIGYFRGPTYNALLGKSITDPEVRTVLEEAKERTGSTKTAAKIDAFLARLPEPVAPPAPAAKAAPVAPPAVMAPAGTAVTFETAKGSQYSVFDDGTTQRNKAPRPEHPGDQGIKERTARTIYVDGDASRLSAAGVENIKGARVIIDDDGTASLVWENPITGKLGASPSSAKIKFHNEPAVGRSPLELWGPTDVFGREGYSGMHAGNKIVKITPVTTPTTPPAAEAAPVQPETPSVAAPQPEAGGAGVPVAGGPAAVSTAEGARPEPDGVVSPVADVAGPTGGERAESTAVTPTVTPPTPAQIERELTSLVESGRITEEQAADYRAELLGEAEEAPTTAMGQAFQKQIGDIKAQMDALRQKSGKPPVKKSPARTKYDALEAQLQALVPQATGNLAERIELLELSSVIGKAPYPGAARESSRVALDIDLLKENLTKAKASPRMAKAILNYIGVDADGNYLPTVYSREEAAEMAGLSAATGSEVSRAAEAMGITLDVRSRFHAGQTELGVGAAKNVYEEGTGATDLNPRRGALYAPKKKGPPTVAPFLRGALAPDGTLDFSEARVPLESSKAKGDKPAVVGLAEMFVRASQFNRKNYQNDSVINALQAEVDMRIKLDRTKTNDAITRAYGKFTETEDVSSNQKALELQIGKDLKSGKLTPVGDIADLKAPQLAALITEGKAEIDEKLGTIKPVQKEAAAPDQTLTEAELRAEEVEADDKTRRLSDEDVEYRLTEASEGQPKEKVEKVVAQVTENWNNVPPIEVVQSETDLPQKIQNQIKRDGVSGRVPGFFNNGRVWLIADNISGAQEVFDTISHEVTGHYGLRGILGPKYKETMGRIYEGNTEIRVKANEKMKVLPKLSREVAVEEVLADMQEKDRSRPLFKRIVGVIRTALQKLFKGKHYFSQDQVEDLLYQSRDWVRNGKPSQKMVTDESLFRLAPATEAAVQGVDVIGEQGEAKPISGNPAVKARIHIANNMAGLFDKFNEWYGGAIRTAGNRLIPTVFISRALDADRVSNEAQLIGGLRKVDELIVASEIRDADGNVVLGADGQPLSYANVLNRIATAAKKAGKSYDEYKKTIDKVLYGHREYYVRENNRLIEQQAAALDAAGKTKEATKLRKNIADLAIKDPKVLDNIEAQFQKDDFIKSVSSDFDAIRFDFLDMLVETGRITKEVAQEWKDNVGYAPFNRVQDYEDTFDAESSRVQGVGVVRMRKKFEGSTRQSTSVIDNFSKLLDWATGEAMRNEAKNRALKDMVLMGAAKPRNGKVLASDEPGGVVNTFEDGVAKEYLVPDPMLFVGFTMHTPEMNSAIRALNRYGTRVLRAGVTMMPPFAIKQVFDDISRAYAFEKVRDNATMVKNILTNFPKNWFNEALGKEVWKTAKNQTSVKDLRRLGIVASYDLSREGNLKNLEVEAKARGESLWNMVLRVMEAGAKASDVSVRQGIYDQVLKETGDKVMAESAAREIINFSYQGSNKLVQGIASVVPFFNAYAQGTDKLAVAAAGKVVGMTPGAARSMFYTRMTTLVALGFLYELMMGDDDEYNKLDAHTRDTNWIIPGAKIGGMPVGIPVPADLAFFFKAIPGRVVQYFKYSGTDEERAGLDVLSELAVRGYDVFSPPNITPQLIRPVLENVVNYSFFLGRPLESQAQLQRRPFERYGVGTSDAMKVVADWLEDSANATGIDTFAVSPIKLENLMRGLLGTAGGTALSVADWMANPTRTDRPLHQQLSTQLTGASALLKSPVGNAYMSEIYSLEKKSEQVYNTYKSQLKTDPDKADKFLEDNIGMYEIRPAVQAVMKQIRALNKIAMEIDKDTSMSPEERRKEIDELRVEQNEIARVVFSLRKEARDIQMGK